MICEFFAMTELPFLSDFWPARAQSETELTSKYAPLSLKVSIPGVSSQAGRCELLECQPLILVDAPRYVIFWCHNDL